MFSQYNVPSSLSQRPYGYPFALLLLPMYLESKVEGLAHRQLNLSLMHSQKEESKEAKWKQGPQQ